ncbi:MAG: hypothetical protein JW969_07385 [Spirochaetales bacterium]|nr:hypothetical protein [Spirochaetales bacterium]
MKIVYISDSEEYLPVLKYHFNPLGFEVEHTDDPEEIIEDIENLETDVIFFNAFDFPRHWKPLLKLLRDYFTKEETVFVLISYDDFPFEEAAKAMYLKVNGIVPRQLNVLKVIVRIEEILKRYKNVNDNRRYYRHYVSAEDSIHFLCTHPERYVLIPGKIEDISIQGCQFIPRNADIIKDLNAGQYLPNCSLRIGHDIISVNCRIAGSKGSLRLEFKTFLEEGHQTLFQYLISLPEKNIKNLARTMPA